MYFDKQGISTNGVSRQTGYPDKLGYFDNWVSRPAGYLTIEPRIAGQLKA